MKKADKETSEEYPEMAVKLAEDEYAKEHEVPEE